MKLYTLTLGLILACFLVLNAENSSTKAGSDYSYELNKLNSFLENFEDGYFGYFEVKDGFVIIRFKEGNYSKFKMEDMAAPILDTKWGQVNWDCKNEVLCVETDWNEDGKESGILFTETGSSNLDYLMELLNSFISAYNSN